VGGQVSGRLEVSTAAFRRFEVANGVNYGLTADSLGEQYRLEFQWNQNKADVRAQPIGGFSSVKPFTMEEFPFQAGRIAPATKNAREIVVLDLSQRNLQTLQAKT
jgi:hypothetical protein